MAKRYLVLSFLIFTVTQLKAQQYGLFNTNTQFDAFENPAQKGFLLDYSRQFASNFLLPYFGLNGANKGDSNYALRRIINGDGIFDTKDIPIDNNGRNKLSQSSNIYLLTFRLFKSYKYQKELGFSWQMRSDAFADYTNETLVAIDDYNRFTSSRTGLFNGNGYGQSYHQFSISYRENYTKKLAFGAKLSLLSGITYNKANINGSGLALDPDNYQTLIGLRGTYKSNFIDEDELRFKTFIPSFKNPGLSVSLGTSYKSKSGVVIMGNIKDLGFIRWSKESHTVDLNDVIALSTESMDPETTIKEKVYDLLISKDQRKGFYSPTNAKADFLISKQFGFYTPNFIISKNVFYPGGDIAVVNNFKYNEFSVALTPTYNMIGFGMLGTQGMYQTPNFEFFLGTDNLLKSASFAKKTEKSISGYAGASLYMGLAIKFGYTVEHPQNSSYMPGVGDDADQEKGFFSKIFGIFRKK